MVFLKANKLSSPIDTSSPEDTSSAGNCLMVLHPSSDKNLFKLSVVNHIAGRWYKELSWITNLAWYVLDVHLLEGKIFFWIFKILSVKWCKNGYKWVCYLKWDSIREWLARWHMTAFENGYFHPLFLNRRWLHVSDLVYILITEKFSIVRQIHIF